MLNIIGKRNWYFAFSILIIIPGLLSIFFWGLPLSIDFTGGTRLTLQLEKQVTQQTADTVNKVFTKDGIEVVSTQLSGNSVSVRTKPMTSEQDAKVLADLQKQVGSVKQEDFENVGPVIGKEITMNAFKAIAFASLLIVLFIAWSFRSVPKPVSSWQFGICAIAALIHDVLVLVGLFSILGHLFHVEIDSLFVTALLTVIGFSVHDTIVVFDRIRENMKRIAGVSFAQLVNDSILQTLARSLNTSLTAMLVLFTLLLFGGESIRWFIVALLIGITSGTYSSIFNAAPLLVVWQNWKDRRRAKK